MKTSTPTPTPRPALKATGMRRRHARCLETELAALTTERDHWQKIAVSASREREHNANVAQAMTAERDQLRAELANQTVRFHDEIVRRQGTVRANQELDLKELNHFRDLLATERARLDWLESDAGMDWQWTDTMYGIVSRAAIDKAMKGDAK